MTTRLPASLRIVPTCQTCKHVYAHGQWEAGDDYYCTLNAPPRPPSNSPDENWQGDLEFYMKASQKWDEWSAGRQVDANTVCDRYAPIAPTPAASPQSPAPPSPLRPD